MKKIFLLLLFSIVSFQSIQAQPAMGKEVELIIDRHNYYRTEVGVQDINYSEELAKVAHQWAIQLKDDNCSFKHNQNSYGENLFKGTVGHYTAGDAVDSWGAEKQYYNYKKNVCDNGEMCGHYTQIVWKNTTEVGCAKMTCDGSVTWVCNYNPPGNYVGQKPY